MLSSRTHANTQWTVVTFNKPLFWNRHDDEVWVFNPARRYLLNAHNLEQLNDYIESISDLSGAALYRPLMAGKNVTGSRILVERMRERGIGDLLFMTGPIDFLNHVTGGEIKIDMYAMSDRGMALLHHPGLHLKTTLAGPLEYDHLAHYNYHWFVHSVTEYDEEPDQLNVYDALYKQLGFEPGQIEPRWKRPSLCLVEDDIRNLDQMLYMVWVERKLDLRRTGYFLVAPLSHSSLRCMTYSTWLNVIKELASRRPTIVVGSLTDRMPFTDISAGDFNSTLNALGNNVINVLGGTSVRLLMALCAKAACVFTLDTGPLYIAQAFRTPTISIWGTHDPGVRIGYDRDYMDLAVWNSPSCAFSPCYAYAQFPVHKCPQGDKQSVCQVLKSVEAADVIKRLEQVESKNYVLPAFSAAAPVRPAVPVRAIDEF